MSNLSIVTTADGSNTIYNAEVGENYHSKHGALQESKHVFINMGLEYYLESSANSKTVSVLEVGFGTGLNFLLSAQYCAQHQIALQYTGIEAYPLTPQLIAATGYNSYVDAELWGGFLSVYPQSLQKAVPVSQWATLSIAHAELLAFNTAAHYNVIYFDAFAAIHQPQMWNEEAIAHTVQFLAPGGVFVTYAITGNLKRQLKALGLTVQKAPGAPGKREMLRAIKPL